MSNTIRWFKVNGGSRYQALMPSGHSLAALRTSSGRFAGPESLYMATEVPAPTSVNDSIWCAAITTMAQGRRIPGVDGAKADAERLMAWAKRFGAVRLDSFEGEAAFIALAFSGMCRRFMREIAFSNSLEALLMREKARVQLATIMVHVDWLTEHEGARFN